MNATTRQTAANNATLKAIRHMMNDAIYRTIMQAWNCRGEEYALDFLSQYFHAESWPKVKAELTGCPIEGESHYRV